MYHTCNISDKSHLWSCICVCVCVLEEESKGMLETRSAQVCGGLDVHMLQIQI